MHRPCPATAASPVLAPSPSDSSSSSMRGFTFNWPRHVQMDLQQLANAASIVELTDNMKSGKKVRALVVSATLKINGSNTSRGYCSVKGLPSDLIVSGNINLNRAQDGDLVLVQLFRVLDWFKDDQHHKQLKLTGSLPGGGDDFHAVAQKMAELWMKGVVSSGALDNSQCPWLAAADASEAFSKLQDMLQARPDLRPTGRVVGILKPSRKRAAVVGVLVPPAAGMAAPNQPSTPPGRKASPAVLAADTAIASGSYKGCLMLVPLDPRLPKCIVGPEDMSKLPQHIKEEAGASGVCRRTFVVGCINDWLDHSPFPTAQVTEVLGPSDDMEACTQALLASEGFKEQDFSSEVTACLPKVPWQVSPAELKGRADFRSWRIYTIDDSTARDLDDALSIQPLEGGAWRIGVHIADVSSFVRHGTPLDTEAQRRGTSVYLVQRVIHMLPQLLSEGVCSLQPGAPHLTVSIVWEVNAEGKVLREWAGRSVISSCAKLAYPLVQEMIEGRFDPAGASSAELYNGVSWEQVTFDCLALNAIASRMRLARIKSGALSMTNSRLSVSLDAAGNVESARAGGQHEANFLVEEFMLLANMRVAGIISRAFLTHALRSRQPPPHHRKIQLIKEAALQLGVKLDESSAGKLGLGLQEMRARLDTDAAQQALMQLATRTLQGAEYFYIARSFTEVDPESWAAYYSLDVGCYTHFTSPIRRFADITVHRQLIAALELNKQQLQSTQELLTAPTTDSAQLPTAVDYSAAVYDANCAAAAAAATAAVGDADASGAAAGASTGQGHAAAAAISHGAWAGDAMTKLSGLQLGTFEVMAQIVKQCNATAHVARSLSDGSARLYLSRMLQATPVVTMAVAYALGGDKYLGAYVPELGLEMRLSLNLMGIPLTGSWDEASHTLTISSKQQHRSSANSSSSSSSSSPRSQLPTSAAPASGSPQGQQGAADAASLDLNSQGFSLKAWLDRLQDAVRNPQNINKVQLPLRVRQFTAFPVVVGSGIDPLTCRVEEPAAKLWVLCGAADEAVLSSGPTSQL